MAVLRGNSTIRAAFWKPSRLIILVVTFISLILFVHVTSIPNHLQSYRNKTAPPNTGHYSGGSPLASSRSSSSPTIESIRNTVTNGSLTKPLSPPNLKTHPIQFLTLQAQAQWKGKIERQSKTLEEAVAEYHRRYRIAPPPHFDKWWAFAQEHNTVLVDEFDAVWEELRPYWGIRPKLLRSNLHRMMDSADKLTNVTIRDGKAVEISEDRTESMNNTIWVNMMHSFSKYLPDMDILINRFDEPRVLIPHSDKTLALQRAESLFLRNASIAAGLSTPNTDEATGVGMELTNDYSPYQHDDQRASATADPKQKHYDVVDLRHQHIWQYVRAACPLDSPMRARFGEEDDEVTHTNYNAESAYCLHDFCFVYNQNAHSDICLSPSLGTSFAPLDRMNRASFTSNFVPVFSLSTTSTFSDISMPNAWYWSDRIHYNTSTDIPWEEKDNQMYWRGGTSSGFSDAGTWRHQHRQHVLQRLSHNKEQPNTLPIFTQSPPDNEYKPATVERDVFDSWLNVSFVKLESCTGDGCSEMKQFFEFGEREPFSNAWTHKFLLDLDGHAFSGRFYAFLKSMSLPLKYSIFREWHEYWIQPWVHYIPLSLRGDEYLEALRHLRDDPDGQQTAKEVAFAGREWAAKGLTKAHMEVYYFRLLLEYARLLDDNREHIGFSL